MRSGFTRSETARSSRKASSWAARNPNRITLFHDLDQPKTAAALSPFDVRFISASGHRLVRSPCPLCAKRTNGTKAKTDSRLSARQQDQDKPDHGGAAAVIDPLPRVHHEALGGPTNQVRALARPEQAHCQEKETDEGKSAFH